VPHPAGLPDLFVDRSLGRIAVPGILREAGLRLITLAERYGIPQAEKVTDERWLEDAGLRSEAVFMKDARVRYNTAEKLVITRFSVDASACRARTSMRQQWPAVSSSTWSASLWRALYRGRSCMQSTTAVLTASRYEWSSV
jgi:hypothetical protein